MQCGKCNAVNSTPLGLQNQLTSLGCVFVTKQYTVWLCLLLYLSVVHLWQTKALNVAEVTQPHPSAEADPTQASYPLFTTSEPTNLELEVAQREACWPLEQSRLYALYTFLYAIYPNWCPHPAQGVLILLFMFLSPGAVLMTFHFSRAGGGLKRGLLTLRTIQIVRFIYLFICSISQLVSPSSSGGPYPSLLVSEPWSCSNDFSFF